MNNMIAIVSDNEKELFGTRLYRYFREHNIESVLVPASNRNIKPCYSCQGCVDKTFGKCIVRDDMDEILPILARADKLVYTTPVVWGQTSYDIKKVMDKTALLGNRFYKMRGREIVKGHSGRECKLVEIGIHENISEKAKSTFLYLINEIGNIMDTDYLAKIIKPEFTEAELEAIAKEVLAL